MLYVAQTLEFTPVSRNIFKALEWLRNETVVVDNKDPLTVSSKMKTIIKVDKKTPCVNYSRI